MSDETDTSSGTSAGTARIEELLFGCLEEGEAHLDDAVQRLCATHPDLAAAIRDAVETARSAGLNRKPTTDSDWSAPPPADTDYQPIGPYQPLSELGRGGQGLVYLAEDTRLHRVVALKILKGFGPLSEKMMQRFKREAEVASKLDHPGICGVYDAGVKDGIPYIAMRFVEGKTLGESIRHARASATPEPSIASFLDLEHADDVEDAPESKTTSTATTTKADVLRVVAIVEKAARALHEAHEAGIIHRDIKPGNIMVTPAGEPVLLDFGLASEEANELSLTQTGDLFGTPAYMSPEQLMAHHIRLDRRTDVYSLAVTLYECVTLTRPFDAPTREAMYHAIQYKHATDARKVNRDVPADLAVVLEKALEKDRDQRYETALDFADDLQRVRELKPVAAKPISPAGRVTRWAKRRPFRAALVAALIVGLPAITGLASYAIAKAPEIAKGNEQALLAEVERHLQVGFGELTHGDVTKALAAFDAALALKADSAEAIGGKALALSRNEDHAACLAFLDAQGEVEAGDWALSRIRIGALEKLGRAGEARDIARRAPPKPTTALGFFFAGSMLMRGCAGTPNAEARWRNALRCYQRAALTAPHARLLYHSELAHAAGHLAEIGKCTDEARHVAATLVELWPNAEAANRMAAFALRDVDPDAAVAAYRRAIDVDPSDAASTHKELGVVLWRTGQYIEAIASYRKAIALGYETAGTYNNLGVVLQKTGHVDEAIAAYERAIELQPNYADAHLNLGFTLSRQGRLDDAIAHYRRAIDSRPDYAEAHRHLGRGLADKGQLRKAIAAYKKAIECDPKNAEAHNDLGGAYLSTGQHEDAITAYRRATKLVPRHASYHSNLGLAYTKKGKLDKAIAACKHATKLDPTCGWINLGGALSAKGKLDAAIAAYEKAIDANPAEAIAHHDLGVALGRRGRLDDAIAAFREAIRLRPSYHKAHINLGNGLAQQGRRREAMAAFRDAVAAKPDFALAHYNLGVSLTSAGELDEAVDSLEKAVDLDPGFALAHASLGRCFQKSGELIPALASFRRGATVRVTQGYRPPAKWLRNCETTMLREARHLATGEARTPASWGEVANLVDALTEGWRDDLKRKRRHKDIKRWLGMLTAREPWTEIRDPKRCRGLPEAEHASWREIWSAIDELAARLEQKR